MKKLKVFLLLTALVLCAALTAAALADGPLAKLWNSGCDFLFRTDNVTVTGQAVFSLDGEWFKTADLNYIQDGYDSYYGLSLLTPRAGKEDLESGWQIFGDEEGNVFVLQTLEPGIYHAGTAAENNTLLRRSVQLDALTELGGLIVAQIEPLLPEGAVTVSEENGQTSLRLSVAEDQIPDVAQSALNLAASHLSDRWFNGGMDRSLVGDDLAPYENYISPTAALTWGTQRWTLRAADLAFDLDAEGRLSAVQGEIRAASTFWDGVVREVAVKIELAMTDYGTSHFDAFDADALGVMLPWEYYSAYYGDDEEFTSRVLTDEEWDYWLSRVEAMLEAQGYSVQSEATYEGWVAWDEINIEVIDADGEDVFLVFSEADESLIMISSRTSPWLMLDDVDPEGVEQDTVDKARTYLMAFLQDQRPDLAEGAGELRLLSKAVGEDGDLYLSFDAPDLDASFYCTIRVEPALRMEYFQCFGGDDMAAG